MLNADVKISNPLILGFGVVVAFFTFLAAYSHGDNTEMLRINMELPAAATRRSTATLSCFSSKPPSFAQMAFAGGSLQIGWQGGCLLDSLDSR